MGTLIETPLFWNPKYLALFQERVQYWDSEALIQNSINTEGKASISFSIGNQILKSPGRASFGGFWATSDKYWEQFSVIDHIKLISKDFPACDYFEINFPAEFFFPSVFLPQQQQMLNAHGEVQDVDAAFFIDTLAWDQTCMNKGNRKKIKQQISAGMSVEEVGHNELHEIYEVIRLNRLSLGVIPSLTFEELSIQINALPENFKLFKASIHNQLVAAAICVKISQDVLYVLYWGDVAEYRGFSPVAGLCEFIVGWCRINQIRQLDLGGTSSDGIPNEGLIRFKRNLGAIESPKRKIRIQL